MRTGAKAFGRASAQSRPAYGENTWPQLLREGEEAARARMVFAVGQRVRIVRGHAESNHDLTPLVGCCGTVAIVTCSGSAWVRMDAMPPLAFATFPTGDKEARYLVRVWPSDCGGVE